MRRAALHLLLVVASIGPACVARADEAALQKRVDELERQNREFFEQLQELRRELHGEKAAEQKAAEQKAAEEKAAEEKAAQQKAAEEKAEPARVDEVERKQGILTEELRRLKEAVVLPETKELKSAYGLGPAASKVYGLQRGLSIGGYGELNFNNEVEDKSGADTFDLLRFVLYFGYKFNDWIVLNTELEVEHAVTEASKSAGSGAVEVEFATLDFLLHPMINARAGLVLVPVGFLNEIHEPPFYHGNVRPPVEQFILPTTWRANGFGLFGEIVPGLQYRTYGITSLNAEGFAADGPREARQSGNRELAHDWSWVARVDYSPMPELLFGGSLYLGDQGQNQTFGDDLDPSSFRKPGVFTQIYDVHFQARTRGLELRALGAYIDIDDAGQLSIDQDVDGPVGNVMLGAYGEIAYDVMPLAWPETTQYLAPWFRYSWLDTQNDMPAGFARDPQQRRQFYEMGLSYEPIPQIVFKLDYRIQDRDGGDLPDEIRVGGGYVF